jgi:hypothetical protein
LLHGLHHFPAVTVERFKFDGAKHLLFLVENKFNINKKSIFNNAG